VKLVESSLSALVLLKEALARDTFHLEHSIEIHLSANSPPTTAKMKSFQRMGGKMMKRSDDQQDVQAVINEFKSTENMLDRVSNASLGSVDVSIC
jgi:hypothetical protein